MGTNDTIRQAAARLIELGVYQTTLAHRMGLTPATFNRWVNGKGNHVISVTAADAFRAYLAEWAKTIAEIQRQVMDEPRS